MRSVYHLDINKNDVHGAQIAILPGDPSRPEIIAKAISKHYKAEHEQLALNREFCTYLARIKQKPILVTSTGIGGPSTSIAIDELAQLGVTTFIRVGTTGAIQEYIGIGDVIITSGAVRLDGASTHYAPIEYPAVSDYEVLNSLVKGATKVNVKYHVGITASSDTFYPGEENKEMYRKYILRKFQGATKEWKELHVLNYEMESSAVLTLTASIGLKGGCVTGVINCRTTDNILKDNLKVGTENAINTVVAALECFL